MKQSQPRTAENARKGGSGQLGKQDMGLAGQKGGSGQLGKQGMGLAGQNGGSGQLGK